MAELLERWLEWRPTVRPIAPTTVSSYRAAMGRYILPALGKLPVRQVDAATHYGLFERARQHGVDLVDGAGLERPSLPPRVRRWA